MRSRVLQRIGAPFSAAAVAAFIALTGYAMAAGTPANTAITNTATANYSDGANNYQSQSNTVTTTVQAISSETVYLVASTPGNTTFTTVNAATGTTTAQNGTIVTPQNTITDSFILTNNGNATANFTITSAGFGTGGASNDVASALSTTNPAADTNASTPIYTAYNCAAGQTQAACIAAAATTQLGGSGHQYTTEATFATAVNGATVATNGGYILALFNYAVGVDTAGGNANSTVPDGTTAVGNVGAGGLQVPTGITATVKSTGAATASTGNAATWSDQVLSDARLDVVKSATQPTTASGAILYSITGNNGGSYAAKPIDLSGVIGTTACGTAPNLCNGFAVSDVIQADSNGDVAKVYDGLTGNGEPAGSAITATCPSGTTATVFYNTSVSPALNTGWAKVTLGTTNLQTGPARLLVLVCSINTTLTLAANPSAASTGSGAQGFNNSTGTPTNPASPQIALTFQTSQAGTLTTTSVTQANIANSIIGNNAPTTSQLVGPGVNSGTTPTATNENAIIASTTGTPTASTGTAPSSGYSKPTSVNIVSIVIGNGPYSAPDAKGDFYIAKGVAAYWTDSTVMADTNHDFTTAVLLGTPTAAIVGGVGSSATTAFVAQNAATTPALTYGANTVQVVHTLKNESTATDSFQVTTNVTQTEVNANGTAGTATWTATYFDANPAGTACLGTNTNITSGGLITSLAAAASINYCVKYTPSGSVNAYDQKPFVVTAASTTNTSVTNITNDLVIAGGFIQITKTAAVSGTASDGTTTCTNAVVLPGCTITYSLVWNNLEPNPAAGTGATSNVAPAITNFAISEDGNVTGSTWYNAASPTTSATTGIKTGVTIVSGDAAGTFAYYPAAAPSRSNVAASCYPITTAAAVVTQCGGTYAAGSSGATLTSTYQAFIYVYGGNIATSTVPPASTGTLTFPLIIRST